MTNFGKVIGVTFIFLTPLLTTACDLQSTDAVLVPVILDQVGGEGGH